MFNNSKLLFILIMVMGTLTSISSNSWMIMWMGLEINLLSIIPLFIQKNNIYSSEVSLKYFLVQTLASSIFLISILLNSFHWENFFILNNSSDIAFMAMSLKLGVAPFHFWFPSIMMGLSWMNCFILMTWQKLAPLIIISYMKINFNLLIIFSIFSVLIGSIGGLNQTSLRKLLAYSSISHMGWLMIALNCGENLWMFYYLIYSFIILSLTFLFNMSSINFLNQIPSNLSLNLNLKLILFLNLLSLGGLPPFLGFIPKWIIIQNLSKNNMILMNLILVMSALITLYFYIRISIPPLTILNFSLKNKMNKIIYFPLILNLFSMMGMMFYPFFILIY